MVERVSPQNAPTRSEPKGTKRSFLTRGRKKHFLALPEDEQMVQLEEAYAELLLPLPGLEQVPLTWRPSWACLGWPCPLLSSWFLTLSFTADESFIDMLQQNCCLSGPHFPPAIVEALQDYVTHVVDLWRPWKYNTALAREMTDQLWRISNCDDTRRVSPCRPEGPAPPLRCRRFAYGYALDGSECPCYLV